MDLDNYLHGECHIFSWALHLELGYPIRLAIDEYDFDIEGEALIHAFCVKGEYAVDVRGHVQLSEILDEFVYYEAYFLDVTEQELRKLVNEGFIHHPKDGQLDYVREYIRSNLSNYQ